MNNLNSLCFLILEIFILFKKFCHQCNKSLHLHLFGWMIPTQNLNFVKCISNIIEIKINDINILIIGFKLSKQLLLANMYVCMNPY